MKQNEILQAQNNQNDNSENTLLIEREQIDGSPFWAIGNKEEGYMLTFGKWQLTEKLPGTLDVIQYLEANKYDIILKMILCIIDPATIKNQQIIKNINP